MIDNWLRRWAAFNDGRAKTLWEEVRWRAWRWWYLRTYGRVWSTAPISMHFWPKYGIWVGANGQRRWNQLDNEAYDT